MPELNLIEGIEEFLHREIAPAASSVDRTGQFPSDRWPKLGEFGLTGLLLPADSGGLDTDRQTFFTAIERTAGACASTAWALLAHSVVVAGIQALGTGAQKRHYLPLLANAQLVGGTLAATETGGGSNLASIRTFAKQDGADFILNGSKFFISQAGVGDVYLIVARTDTTAGAGALSCFIVEKGMPGIIFGKREETLGMRGIEVREIFFDGCRVPGTQLLGDIGGGLAVLQSISGIATLGAAYAATGVAQAAVDATTTHLHQRKVLGEPLAANPAIQARMARVFLDLGGARAWLDRALAWVDSGSVGAPLPVWMAKIAATEAARRIVDQCLGLHGAIGYSVALPLERAYRDVRAFSIHWGNNEVLEDMIGKTVLA